MHEFHTMVEHSYNTKKHAYILRFLDGTCLRVPIEHLPLKLQIKHAKWNLAEISEDKTMLVIPTEKKKLKIPAHVLYSSGKIL